MAAPIDPEFEIFWRKVAEAYNQVSSADSEQTITFEQVDKHVLIQRLGFYGEFTSITIWDLEKVSSENA